MKPLVASVDGIARNFIQLRGARLPWLIFAVLLCTQLWVESRGGYLALPGCYQTFGLSLNGVLHGEVWQLITHAFLHGSWLHALANASCLLMLGTRIEYYLGGRALLRVLGIGVIGGAVAHLSLAPLRVEIGPLVGSSAACFGLLTLITTLSPESRMWPLPVSGRNLGLGLLFSSAVLALIDPSLEIPGLSFIGHWFSQRGLSSWWSIGHACHFGGALAGWLYGRWLLRPRVSLNRLRRERARREADARVR